MSRLEKLAALVKEGHAVAARDIFKLFEQRIAKYEEEIRLLKEVNSRQQEELDSLFKPGVVLHRANGGGRHTPSKEEEAGPTLQQQITKYPLSYNDETPQLVVIKEEEQPREFLIRPPVCEKSEGKLEEPQPSSDSHCNPGGGLSDNSSDTDDSADWETEPPARNWMTTSS